MPQAEDSACSTTTLSKQPIDREHSYVIGDRETDLQLADNLGIQGIRVRTEETPGDTWPEIAARLATRRARVATVVRKTKETDIKVEVNLDRESPIHIETGLGFFDHMLEQIAKHGGFSLQLTCKGDLHIDEHHTVEDCALALGQALKQALGDKRGIHRYGFLLPMDEALAQVAIDLSGRPYFVFEDQFGRDTRRSAAHRAGAAPSSARWPKRSGAAINLKVQGDNTHHMIEACFKGVGRTLRQAFHITDTELPSTKGTL